MQIYNGKKFEKPIEIIESFDNESFLKAFSRIEELRKQNLYILGYIRYDAGKAFIGKSVTSANPLLYFEVFENFHLNQFEFELLHRSTNL